MGAVDVSPVRNQVFAQFDLATLVRLLDIAARKVVVPDPHIPHRILKCGRRGERVCAPLQLWRSECRDVSACDERKLPVHSYSAANFLRTSAMRWRHD